MPRRFTRPRVLAAARGLLWISAGLASPASISGQTDRASPTLDAAVARALRDNPDIVAARLRADSAHGEQRIAREWPSLGASIIPAVPYQYSIAAPLDVGPQRIFRVQAASRGMQAVRADAEDVARQVTFAVRQAFYDILLAEAERALTVRRQEVFRQLLAADSARLAAGDLPQYELARSEVELARAESDRTRADAAVHTARLTLQLLMGEAHPDTGFTISGALAYRPVEIPGDSLLMREAADRPDLRAARARIGQSQAAKRLAGSTWVPTPLISLVYQPGEPFATGSHYAVGLGLTFSPFNWFGGERERARAGVEASILAEGRARAGLVNDIQTALESYDAARGLTERYEHGLLARTQAALETTRYAYQRGAASLLELLDAVRTYTETQSDYDLAIHDYWISIFALSRATGKDLAP